MLKPDNMCALETKKICIVSPEPPTFLWGDLPLVVTNVSHHLRDLGHSVHLVRFTIVDDPIVLLDENHQSAVSDGLTIHSIRVGRHSTPEDYKGFGDTPHTLSLQMMFQSLEILHGDESFDLFHSYCLYPMGYVTGILARKYGKPSIVTIVGNDVNKYFFSPEKVAACRSGLDNADRVVALSRDLLDTAHALTPVTQKGRVIYGSVQPAPAQTMEKARGKGPFRIGAAGIFRYSKGLPYLLKAVAYVKGLKSVSLQLVGSVKRSERPIYDEMVDRTGVGDVLELHPPMPIVELRQWLASLDLFVLSSVSEGFPVVLAEAMAMGIPCVATRAGAASDLIEHGISGLLVPPGDAIALVDAIDRVMAAPDRCVEMGRKARERISLFTPEREREAWRALYEELMGG